MSEVRVLADRVEELTGWCVYAGHDSRGPGEPSMYYFSTENMSGTANAVKYLELMLETITEFGIGSEGVGRDTALGTPVAWLDGYSATGILLGVFVAPPEAGSIWARVRELDVYGQPRTMHDRPVEDIRLVREVNG